MKIYFFKRSGVGYVDLVILYGSFTKNIPKDTSDVDIAIAVPHKFSLDVLLRTALHLETALHRQVDIVDLAQTHGVLLHEILLTVKFCCSETPLFTYAI